VLDETNPLGDQDMFRMNWLHPPFDNQKVRQAALAALNQEDFLKAVIGDPRYYKTCPAMFVCGTSFATDVGGEVLMKSDFERSKQLLEEAGYDGTPVVLMHSTDVQVLANLAPVECVPDLICRGRCAQSDQYRGPERIVRERLVRLAVRRAARAAAPSVRERN
jgi:hypothetical protein